MLIYLKHCITVADVQGRIAFSQVSAQFLRLEDVVMAERSINAFTNP